VVSGTIRCCADHAPLLSSHSYLRKVSHVQPVPLQL
jgi:hypothetical protein